MKQASPDRIRELMRYISQHPYVQYQPDLPGYSKRSFDAEQLLVREGINSASQGYYSKIEFSATGAGANRTFGDGINDIISGRRPFEDYDQLVADWRSTAGDTIRAELTVALAGRLTSELSLGDLLGRLEAQGYTGAQSWQRRGNARGSDSGGV